MVYPMCNGATHYEECMTEQIQTAFAMSRLEPIYREVDPSNSTIYLKIRDEASPAAIGLCVRPGVGQLDRAVDRSLAHPAKMLVEVQV
jgi:hypothetical protein